MRTILNKIIPIIDIVVIGWNNFMTNNITIKNDTIVLIISVFNSCRFASITAGRLGTIDTVYFVEMLIIDDLLRI